MTELTAIGITCGVGSLLIGARDAGFSVRGNLEWRRYYSEPDAAGRTTFGENFPGATYRQGASDLTPQEVERMMNPVLALGHPECGNFSQLSGANKGRLEKMLDPADIPLFVDLVAQFRPRFFVMDDLPKSFMAFPMEEYHRRLPDYDLFPEWVSNYHYGNVQKGRKRMFMLGSLKSEGWAFRPGERDNQLTVADVIGDLPEPRAGANFPNHDPHDDALDCFRALNLGSYRHKATWGEVREYFRDKLGGHTLDYVRIDGSVVKRIGFLKGHWDGPSHVLTGGNAIVHGRRGQPYTLRERLRIQGAPDDFVLYGTVLNDQGEWNHDTNMHMVKQSGKFMPVQFGRYVSQQIAAFVQGVLFECSDQRLLPPNEYVDQAKQWYCANVGYSNQDAACGSCWMATRCSLPRRVGSAPQTQKARPAPAPRQPAAPRSAPSPVAVVATVRRSF